MHLNIWKPFAFSHTGQYLLASAILQYGVTWCYPIRFPAVEKMHYGIFSHAFWDSWDVSFVLIRDCWRKISIPVWILYKDYILCAFGICYTSDTLRPGENIRLFADDLFPYSCLREDKFRLKFHLYLFLESDNTPVLVQIMAWCRPGDKPLSEPMMFSLLTHICVIS